MSRKYSGILSTLCNPQHIQNTCIFKTLAYSEPKAYAEHWDTQNRGILFRTLRYSEPKANSGPCQTYTMEHCAKLLTAIVVFPNYNYFCNISFSCFLLFRI